jgi:signal transduction histidine kinase
MEPAWKQQRWGPVSWVVKLSVFLYVLYHWIFFKEPTYTTLVLFMAAALLTVWKERFTESLWPSLLLFLVLGIGVFRDSNLAVLLSIVIYDFVKKGMLYGTVVPLAVTAYAVWNEQEFAVYLLVFYLFGMFAHRVGRGQERESQYRHALDEERRARYELEQTKAQLMKSSKEIAEITEVKERNRIAREIHDIVGHQLAAILIQLRTAMKLKEKGRETEKAEAMLYFSIDGLSDTLVLLRDTVHNIKPNQRLGIEYLEEIIDGFPFCPVDFQYSGNPRVLEPEQMELIASNLREALTNSSRYSEASRIEVRLDMKERFIRLSIKDNGKGCPNIREGLGLSGIRERVRNMGGTLTVSGDNGFHIVCVLMRREGDGVHENHFGG